MSEAVWKLYRGGLEGWRGKKKKECRVGRRRRSAEAASSEKLKKRKRETEGKHSKRERERETKIQRTALVCEPPSHFLHLLLPPPLPSSLLPAALGGVVMLGRDTPRSSPSRIPINPPSPCLILNTLSAMQRREAGWGGGGGVWQIGRAHV